ncbi:hypothetical protein P5706_33795 [Pseudomonas sp. ChxA]|nr:hypothetical protein [Pseudomonas sp. ChxA]MDL2189153.1 hypothetical protein [Pseudomonas sp. ChxA]MDN2627039.1 hypothetical protein [Klebsiella pneumoniae]
MQRRTSSRYWQVRAQSTLRTVCPRPSLPHVESGLAEEPGSDRSNRQFSERGEGVGAGPADGVAALAEA